MGPRRLPGPGGPTREWLQNVDPHFCETRKQLENVIFQMELDPLVIEEVLSDAETCSVIDPGLFLSQCVSDIQKEVFSSPVIGTHTFCLRYSKSVSAMIP